MEQDTLRHSTSHIMAQAVKRLFPGVKLAIGPAIEDGFYYDFDVPQPFLEEDLPRIEAEMAKIIKENYKFEKSLLKKEEALKLFEKMGEPYKVELIREIQDSEVTIYKNGDLTDLCRGPHIDSTGQVKAFKLLSIAGAYWRGDEKNKMLQRIYGTVFETKAELDAYVAKLEEAKKRDHRKLGKELELFMMDEKAGAGLVIYQPKGAMLRTIIEDWEKKEHLKRGYQIVIGPHMLKSDIWVESGHYGYYKENMYIFQVEGQEYAIKPMNCPAHILIYRSKTRSYKDLPIRYFELGSVYRYEKSGVLHGLLRVRGFTQDDAHIFCLREQAVDEIKGVIDFVMDALKVFGFADFEIELSTKPDKCIGTDEDWELATNALVAALKSKGLAYNVHEKEGAFYGPKIDIKLKDALGRAWQCATIQCDFALPQRFKISYVGPDGKEYTPIMLHRVILGSMERFLGALIEHYGGAFPVWLSPVQAVIIPIADEHKDYAKKVEEELRNSDIRVEIDDKNARMQHKIREAETQKVPYMLIVGGKEAQTESVSVRERGKGDLGPMKLSEFIGKIADEINGKK
ncbi:MAG: threonine--tRNA ligase [Candidatus Omnitrophica bacterium]|nr:threonine--tRNA ligase [Candidatus Omnitrophota bacterium]MDD5310149.1 threonine--tRNA ligase [Candidatus Omnitrophota bacterium]MDD5546274.1 threonine--tRNA ligase [Candidatus Omnitrophota bacterium]